MDNHFLTDIDIIDFKCFQNFSAKGFKRVNLIGGKNNIGKTAFMEACYVNVTAKDVKNMISSITNIKFFREKINLIIKGLNQDITKDFFYSITHYCAKSNLGVKEFFIKEEDGKKEYHFSINGNISIVNVNQINIDSIVMYKIAYFIDKSGLMDSLLGLIYETIQKQDKEEEVNNLIKEFDKNIVKFKVIANKPMCKTNGQYQNLVEFGDGLKHYVSIICALYNSGNGYLFIDEIGDGIHYQQLDRLWEIILTISKETNCQVFATTHSKEMLESFARVSQKLNEQDISFITLVKNDKNEIKALVRNYELFLDSIEQEHEIRW
jgi:AAA15 family ATPase/GTPase